MKKINLIILLLTIASTAGAVIAIPTPVEKRMSDGTIQQVYVRGDESHHYLTRLDGTIIPGTEVSTVISEDDVPISKRAQAKYQLSSTVPNKGTVRIPVILVNFTDLSFSLSNPVDQFSALYNTNGGSNPNATGSVHDYFYASSDSALNLVFDVYGPYNLSKGMAYYGANSGDNHNVRASTLIIEAATLARDAGVDFTPYDNDNDGTIDNLSVVVAGHNEAEGGDENTIWPHYSRVSTTTTFSGKQLSGYLVISEFRGSSGSTQAGIGTYCHEFGHALGLPDLYDTKEGDNYTVGTWDVMCQGCYNNNGSTPPTFTAFERFMLGWLIPEQLQQVSSYVLEPIETSNQAYLIAEGTHNISTYSPSPSEYFLLENRQPLGWDANGNTLVGTGMLVTHITFSLSTWNANTFNNTSPLGCAIESAGIAISYYSSPADVFPGTANITTWIPELNNGTKLTSQLVMNITELDDNSIVFFYGANGDKGFAFQPQMISDMTTTYNKEPIEYNEEVVELSIRDLQTDSIKIRTSSTYFEYSCDGGETWHNSEQYLSVYSDSTYTISLLVRYAPDRQSCYKRTGFLIVESQDGQYISQLLMEASAPRPTYITVPTITDIQNVTESSFTAYWEKQDDAEYYYVTLYSISPVAAVEEETFETFNTVEDITNAGWDSNFARLTNAESEKKYAVLFSQTGEYLTSKEYIEAPKKVRFWLSNTYVPIADESDASGYLLFQATTDGLQWDTLENISVHLKTTDKVMEYDIQGLDYTRFRFTYTHTRGSGGPVIDGFTATMEHTINYVCKDREREVPALSNCATFTNLTGGTTYYLSVQAYENKGCEEHLTAMSPVQVIRTTGADDNNVTMTIRINEDNTYTALLQEPLSQDATLCIFDYMGHIVEAIAVPMGETEIDIPTAHLVKGNTYILKIKTTKLQRKAAKGKLQY